MGWRDKPYECPGCGWQGQTRPVPLANAPTCPECGDELQRRTWVDTWGLTLLILGAVVGVVLFVAYVPYLLR